jgi:N-acyl-D-aspartate/D-glutamate deacylase
VHVVQAARAGNRPCEDRSVAELAAQAGKHPLDFLLDLSVEEDLDTVFTAVLLNSDEDAVGRMLRDPPFLCDAGFGLHFLGHWVRGRGLMPFEEAVRRMTSYPAGVFGIRDRGRLAAGAWADLLLIDPAVVGRGPARRVRDLPASATRLDTPALGVHGVWVNGRRTADASGILDEVRPAGKVMREFDA